MAPSVSADVARRLTDKIKMILFFVFTPDEKMLVECNGNCRLLKFVYYYYYLTFASSTSLLLLPFRETVREHFLRVRANNKRTRINLEFLILFSLLFCPFFFRWSIGRSIVHCEQNALMLMTIVSCVFFLFQCILSKTQEKSQHETIHFFFLFKIEVSSCSSFIRPHFT